MTFTRFVVSSLLVSTTFAIFAYVLLYGTPQMEEPTDLMRQWGVLYLAFIPYFLGAMINKEGYWHRSDSVSELLNPSEERRREMKFARYGHVAVVVAFLASVIVFHTLGYALPREIILLMLGILWGVTLTRAWFIYRESAATHNS